MSKYGHMRIPKTTNVIIKLFYIDMVIVFGIFIGFLGSQQIAYYIGLQDVYQIMLMLYGAIAGAALTATTHYAPQIRNYRVLMNVINQDKNKYYPIFLEGQKIEGKTE